MSKGQDAYEANLRARFMRPDAARWIRPDAARFIRPDVARFLKLGTHPAEVFPALDQKYSPNQRRVPAGQPGGGRWTNGSGEASDMPIGSENPFGIVTSLDSEPGDISADQFIDPDFAFSNDLLLIDIDSTNLVSDVETDQSFTIDQPTAMRVAEHDAQILNEFGEPYYQQGGHHELVRKIYGKWELQPETLEVFKGGTTGKLPVGRVTGPDGELRGHYWDSHHRDYTDAVTELSNRFLRENDIMDTRRMTPDQAKDLLAEIRRSEDPIIRDYNRAMRYISRIFRSGFGRGNQ